MTPLTRRSVLGAVALAGVALPFGQAGAQDKFPSRTITIIAGTSAGSSTDVHVRFIAQKLEEKLGVRVLVENQPGASGGVATNAVRKSAPDGYTLISTVSGFFIAASQMQPDLNLDPRRDLTAVARTGDQYLVILTRKDSPITTITDIIEMAKQKPGAVTYATTGVGGTAHLHMELFSQLNGIQLLHVPFAGSRYLPDLLSGRVELASSGSGNLIVNKDELKGLLVGAYKRSDLIPDVPTSGDLGLPEYEIPSWVGFFGPAGLPPEVLAKYDEAFSAIMADPKNVQGIRDIGFDPHYEGSGPFKETLARDYTTLGEVIERAGLKPK
ncbi:tripartite tricarboxylate transporter substrate binding protein [Corticibacterium sp. UT-5YL-CI-8]|nr:tripartite tricarboxylate transporter substrate binding protein [Tianweitania sp. UT-5YL-CI-8]